MPYKYAVESICDRIAASKIYNGEKYNAAMPLEYWTKQKQNNYSIGEEMSKFYDIVFSELAKHGENRILKREYLQEQYKICYEEYQIKN